MLKIYDTLFYFAYTLALRSKANRESPLYFSTLVVLLCLMFNAGTIIFILEGAGLLPYNASGIFDRKYRFIGVAVFILIVYFLYAFNGRHKHVYEKFSKERAIQPSTSFAVFIVILFYIVSFLLLLFAGLYKNKSWIFSN